MPDSFCTFSRVNSAARDRFDSHDSQEFAHSTSYHQNEIILCEIKACVAHFGFYLHDATSILKFPTPSLALYLSPIS